MEQISPHVAEQIRRIETGLPSDAPLWSQAAEPATISQRLARHATPAVSVAIINNGVVEWARGYGIVESGRSLPVPLKPFSRLVPLASMSPWWVYCGSCSRDSSTLTPT